MTHDPHANNHWKKTPPRGRPWTAEEDAKLRQLRDRGLRTEDMTDHLKRTIDAITCRITYLKLSKKKVSLPKIRAVPRVQLGSYTTPIVPPDVWEDRNRRLMAQRSVTASICGDPPAGFSALEKRT